MMNRPGADVTRVRRAVLPPRLAAAFRPELPALADEIIGEIKAAIPEYAQAVDGAYHHALRVGVHQALNTFIDRIADPDAPSDDMAEVCRQLGRYEAYEGRSMDSLQAAYRIGAQVAWRRAMDAGRRLNVSSSIVSDLADLVFAYMDELAALSLEGYQEARAKSLEGRRERYRRLLRGILEQPPMSMAALVSIAGLAGWALPADVTLVAIRAYGKSAGRDEPAEPHDLVDAYLLDDDVLSDLACPEPHVLVPGPLTRARDLMLKDALNGVLAAIGPTVPLAQAADSLRWARQALSLAELGVITDTPVISCEDHLETLWLLSDLPLAQRIARRELAALGEVPLAQRNKLTETLWPWLATGGTAVELGRLLGIHPQTVRYRMHQCEEVFGERLSDPDGRFALELALRLMRVIQRGPGLGEAPD
jgi:hypothetical protein